MNRFDELQTFVAVADAGSFTGAAERLHLAKSAVSRRVSELEARLGVQLFNRSTRRLSATEAGRQFYERAVRLLADLDEAEQSVTSGQAALRGRVRIAAPLSFGLLHLGPALSQFLQAHPDVTLDVNLDDRRVNLIEEGYDLAIRIAELGDSTLIARRLAPIRMVACASPGYLERHGEPMVPEALTEHPGLFYGNLSDAQNWPYSGPGGRPLGTRVPVRMRANNGDVLLQAAVDGLGVCIVPTFLGYRELRDGRLRMILRDHPLPELSVYALYPSRRNLPGRVRALIDFLAARFGEQEAYWDAEADGGSGRPARRP